MKDLKHGTMEMKFILLLAIVALPNLTFSQTKLSKEQKEVYNTMVLIGNAWVANNMDTLEKYIDKEYLHTDVMGQALNKNAWFNDIKEKEKKGIKIPGMEFEDIDIRIYKDLAFATGANVFSMGANASGLNETRKLRFTQVLRRENKIWKRLLFQATYVTSTK